MSLTAREKQALDSIEQWLAGSDPKLAALLATFTRLTSGEDMPVREKIAASCRRATRHRRRRRYRNQVGWAGRVRAWIGRPRIGRPRIGRPRIGRPRIGLLLWLTITVTMIVVAVAISQTSGRQGCVQSTLVVCAGHARTTDVFARPLGGGSRLLPGARTGRMAATR